MFDVAKSPEAGPANSGVCFFAGLLRYKVDFQSMQLDDGANGDEFDLEDY